MAFRLQRIQSINSENRTWRAGVNQFTDLTDEELVARTRGLDRSMYFAEIPLRKSAQYAEDTTEQQKHIPEQDWRKSGVITPVKNQGHCGECNLFCGSSLFQGEQVNATSNIEHFIMPTLSALTSRA